MTNPTILQLEPVRVDDSIAISSPIIIDNAEYPTTYTAGQTMSDETIIKVTFTAYNDETYDDENPTASILSSNGVLQTNIIMNRDAASSSTAVFTIAYGFQTEVVVRIDVLGVIKTSGGALIRRKLGRRVIRILPRG